MRKNAPSLCSLRRFVFCSRRAGSPRFSRRLLTSSHRSVVPRSLDARTLMFGVSSECPEAGSSAAANEGPIPKSLQRGVRRRRSPDEEGGVAGEHGGAHRQKKKTVKTFPERARALGRLLIKCMYGMCVLKAEDGALSSQTTGVVECSVDTLSVVSTRLLSMSMRFVKPSGSLGRARAQLLIYSSN